MTFTCYKVMPVCEDTGKIKSGANSRLKYDLEEVGLGKEWGMGRKWYIRWN
ncbi:hypothetical protein THF1C08_100080 [Vibrio jasicida]|uniref:Uncharacterized protein n=1 Tax=Vibrio jasicida TaxID=766224 RepID=A0AAU9QYQ6_9VIBR|nr:hypothetical protein THF1C08_100080 [Vibrio jasicida]CAH1603976.1 hypothetical protein THF1A12_90080 [Vibrio jasicida]CAH6827634.1 conserved hypothetical protein [Vibrio chagasii]